MAPWARACEQQYQSSVVIAVCGRLIARLALNSQTRSSSGHRSSHLRDLRSGERSVGGQSEALGSATTPRDALDGCFNDIAAGVDAAERLEHVD